MLVDGNMIAKTLEEKLATELLFLSPKKVCFVIFGGNVVTEQFVKNKSQVAERVGIVVEVRKYPDVKTTSEAVALVQGLSKDNYDGIVVQLPLAHGISAQEVLDAVPSIIDIDVLGTLARDSYIQGTTNRTPPVAQAVYEILRISGVKLKDKNIVIVGQGRLVGKPVHLMLEKMHVPHDVVDIKMDLKKKLSLFKNADIIISGIGVPHSIKPDMIKDGVVLIDAGTSEQGGKLVGDIDPSCESKASLITPVPGGVGPITIVSLLRNLL